MKGSMLQIEKEDIPNILHEIFEDRKFNGVFAEFYLQLQEQIERIDPEEIEKTKETLRYWHPETDWDKVDKLRIIYERCMMI